MKFLIFSSVLFLTASVYGDWVAGPWKECSAVCDGVQVRKVYCKNPVTGDVAPDSLCDAKPKPATSQPCSPPCTYEWVAGEWGECSEICGPGFQSRSVQCTKVETSEAVSESYCDSPSMPALTQPCDLGVCIDEDIVDEDINDEDFIDGEAGEDIADVDEIFIDEDNTDNETVTDESETTDNVQTIDEAQTVDNETDTDSDTAVNDDTVNDETADSTLSDEDSSEVDNENSEEDDDSGCGCNVIGL